MTIIDRYILRSFLKSFCLWFICFIGIYIVFDLFTKMDSFLKAGGGVLGAVVLICKFYAIQSLPFFNMISPILCLTSAMFTIGMLIRHNELTPILAAGISRERVIKPIIFAVVILTGCTAICRETLLPMFMDDLMKDPAKFVSHDGSDLYAATDYNSGFMLLGNKVFYKEREITEPNISFLDKSLSVHGKKLNAKEAVYYPAKDGKPSGFLMKDVMSPQEILRGPSLALDGRPIVITPKDADWLESGDCFVVSKIPFAYIASNESWRENASTWEYISAIRGQSLDIGVDIESKIHARILQPFLDMTLFFLGIPIILTRGGERNVFKAMGLVALIVFSFLVVQYGALFFGRNSEMPVLGAWFPIIVFIPIAIYLYRKMADS